MVTCVTIGNLFSIYFMSQSFYATHINIQRLIMARLKHYDEFLIRHCALLLMIEEAICKR